MKGRDKNQIDIYKVIDWRNELFYLICYSDDNYDWVRCYEWGKCIDHFISKSNPMEFISDRVRSFNIKTSTGVKLIKQLKKLPFDLAKNKEKGDV